MGTASPPTERREDVLVVHLPALTAGSPSVSGFLGIVREDLKDESIRGVVLDFSIAEYADSSSLAIVAMAFTMARRAGKNAVLFVPRGTGRHIRRMLEITGIGLVVETFETMDDALAAATVSPESA